MVTTALLAACGGTESYDQFYSHQAPRKYPPVESVVYVAADPDADQVYEATFQDFLIIGRLHFNGPWEGENPYIAYGKKVGADIVLVSTEFESEREIQDSYEVPTTDSVDVSGYDSDGNYVSGTGTVRSTRLVPYSYTVTRYDHTALFLKRVGSETKAPWEYTRADFPRAGDASRSLFVGPCRNDNYAIDVVETGREIVAFVRSASPEATQILVGLNPSLKWSEGDLKFRFDRRSGQGIYLMASKAPKAATLEINQFGHLQIRFGPKSGTSFERADAAR